MTTSLLAIDWIVIGGYLAFSLGVGIVLARRAGRSTDDYFISGRHLPWWLAGTSMVATSFAADTPLYVTGLVRKGGIQENWFWWTFAIGGMFSVFLLSRMWRRARVVTDVELTELRYSGPSAAALRGFRAAYMAIPINCITMAWVILAMKKLLGVILGIDPLLSVAICVAIAAAYAVLSGFWGVVVTDLVQFVIAMAGSILLCVLSVRSVGGLRGLSAHFAGDLRDNFLCFFPSVPEGAGLFNSGFWSGPLFAFVVFISVQWWANKNADGGGAIIQRMSATKNEKHSLLATLWFNVANYALRPWPWILVALVSIIVLPAGTDGEEAYPMMITRFIPPGLMGLMIASFLGAFMSTIDTHLNLSSSYAVNDFYKRFVRRDASESYYVLVSRCASIWFVLMSAAIALNAKSIGGMFKFLVAFSSGVGLVYILRWFWWRVNAWSEISAMIASSVIASTLHILNARAGGPDIPYPVLLLATVGGSTLVWLLVTFATPPVSRERLMEFYRRVRPSGFWGPIPGLCGLAPTKGVRGNIAAWLAGAVMVLAATLAPGKLLLGELAQGLGYLAVTVVCGVVVWKYGIAPLNHDGPKPGN